MAFIKKYTVTFISIISFTNIIFIFSCNDFKKNASHKNTPDANIAKGKILAATYCQSCHLLPDPLLLDTKSWDNGVLPAMGPRLGIFYYGFKEYPSSINDPHVEKRFYPAEPIISFLDWQNIIDYYTAISPDSLPTQQREFPINTNSLLFKVEQPLKNDLPANTCLVTIDTSASQRRLIVADMTSKNIFQFDSQLKLIDSFNINNTIVDIEIHQTEFFACNIGVMNPNNGKYGSLQKIGIDQKGRMQLDSSLIIKGLARPVQLLSADLNSDGRTDYIICEYGNLDGALSWMENVGNSKFVRHILRQFPGAIKAYIRDVNNDGLADIWVLFSQGDEGIFLFTNKGKGKFEQEQVLRFQPVFGSTYFELADFNKDGFPDILYTCGDNADYSPVLKPYHGVYIFINDGSNHFKQQYFFPMHGCFKAMARDFDADGDLDIAAISFFADYVKKPEESFLYLANKGNLNFQPFTIPGTEVGRWLTMDAADLDGDAKPDIVLGNFSSAPSFLKSATNWNEGPPFIVLKNIIKNK